STSFPGSFVVCRVATWTLPTSRPPRIRSPGIAVPGSRDAVATGDASWLDAAVDLDRGAVDTTGRRARQEYDRVRDVSGGDESAERDLGEHARPHRSRQVDAALGFDDARCDDVGADPARRQFLGQRSGEPGDAGLCRGEVGVRRATALGHAGAKVDDGRALAQ